MGKCLGRPALSVVTLFLFATDRAADRAAVRSTATRPAMRENRTRRIGPLPGSGGVRRCDDHALLNQGYAVDDTRPDHLKGVKAFQPEDDIHMVIEFLRRMHRSRRVARRCMRTWSSRVDRKRITLVPYVSLEEYFRWYNAVEIALDTTPYSGGTTTFDALWMGVPVLTVPGVRPSSRSAASVLTTIGLTDWIASTPEDYVQRAVQFAGERTLIAELRRSLRSRMRASPLMDEARFARNMEDVYRRMWRSWCAEGKP